MPTCLLGLGSNLGDSEVTLRAAVAEITALPDVQLVRHSEWRRTQAIGGPADQPNYVNGAALVETTVPPARLLAELQHVETRHGRTREERWAPRTLDIDILLYGNEVTETAMLTLPHPRMTFRRFVLEPAVETAPKMLHPTIGWPIERLLLHLQQASNQVAIVTASDPLRKWLTTLVAERSSARPIDRPTFAAVDHFWPEAWTAWFEVAGTQASAGAMQHPALSYAAADFPKLSILLDADIAGRGADKLQWSTLVRKPGRGPTLRLQTTTPQEIEAEVLAAVNAVWP